jgi:S-adenosylmethionine decarboxylase proenzyme
MEGLHLTADLEDCTPAEPALLVEPQALRDLCLSAVAAVGLHAVAELFHRFEPPPQGGPAGITGVVLLAESHLAIHTWPECRAVTLDVYVCNFGADNSARADQLLAWLHQAFAPRRTHVNRLHRGGGLLQKS